LLPHPQAAIIIISWAANVIISRQQPRRRFSFISIVDVMPASQGVGEGEERERERKEEKRTRTTEVNATDKQQAEMQKVPHHLTSNVPMPDLDFAQD
jgi:hypothetical protein